MSDNRNENRETVADIFAEMRERADAMQTHGTAHGVRLAVLEFARRIDAAWKRERAKVEADALAVGGIVEAARTAEKSSAVGNAAAMREALEAARDLLLPQCNGGTAFAKACGKTVNKIMDALSAPARNCDVGTSASQGNLMRRFCAKQKRNGIINCGYCQIKHQYERDCTLDWAQMPYEAEEGGKE